KAWNRGPSSKAAAGPRRSKTRSNFPLDHQHRRTPVAAVDHDLAHPLDVCFLLRAHGEQLWLTAEVLPVLDELEPPCSVPDEQVGAAFAYLEMLSVDAARRAR